jgi:hypothetical protein
MSSYVKSTNFASKDSLAIGNPLKIVKGTEIDEEFNNIATAIDTKADLNSPIFIGAPVAPTAAPGTNTTQLATTAFVQSTLQAALAASVYPVGSLYLNATNATNPATLLGFGTWVSFGAGRMPVGFNAADPLFDAAEETGGSKDATLVSHNHTGNTGTESAGHSHGFSGTTSGVGDHQHYPSVNGNTNGYAYGGDAYNVTRGSTDGLYQNTPTTPAGAHSHTFSGNTGGISANHTHGFTTSTSGSSATNANLPPYITVYMWKRTA